MTTPTILNGLLHITLVSMGKETNLQCSTEGCEHFLSLQHFQLEKQKRHVIVLNNWVLWHHRHFHFDIRSCERHTSGSHQLLRMWTMHAHSEYVRILFFSQHVTDRNCQKRLSLACYQAFISVVVGVCMLCILFKIAGLFKLAWLSQSITLIWNWAFCGYLVIDESQNQNFCFWC